MQFSVSLPDGAVHTVPGKPKASVMESIRSAGLPIRAECGGAMACATCHVHVEGHWIAVTGKAGDEESDLLDASDYRADNSRLSCQIKISDALDGLQVALQLDAYEG